MAHSEKQLKPEKFDNVWFKYFLSQVYQLQKPAEAWPSSTFEIEGHIFPFELLK